MKMKKLKWVGLLAALLLLSLSMQSQQVSTLVNDANRGFEAIHWLDDGRIYATDYEKGKLYSLDLEGNVETLVDEFTNVAGGGVDQEGNFYFSDFLGGDVYRLNEDNSYTSVVSGIVGPVGVIAGEKSDEILVASYYENAVYKCNVSTGEKSKFASGNGINGPDGIIRHIDGDLLVANFNNTKIHKVDSSGNVTLFSDLGVSSYMGYITRHDSTLYATAPSVFQVYQVDMEGNAKLIAGSGVTGSKDGDASEATFIIPNGIAASATGDTLLVADGNTVRMIAGLEDISSSTSEFLHSPYQIIENPVREHLRISLPEDRSSSVKWSIIDSSGNNIKVGTISNMERKQNIDVSNLPSGVYLFQVISISGLDKTLPFVKV